MSIFFDVYMDELCSELITMDQDAPTINDIKIPYLFLLLISTTNDRLQNQVHFVNDYCFDWKLALHAERNKNSNFQ